MTAADSIHDAIMDHFHATLEDSPTSYECSLAADAAVSALRDEFPLADLDGSIVSVLRDALERISNAYPGDHDYPGLVARRALDSTSRDTQP